MNQCSGAGAGAAPAVQATKYSRQNEWVRFMVLLLSMSREDFHRQNTIHFKFRSCSLSSPVKDHSMLFYFARIGSGSRGIRGDSAAGLALPAPTRA
jgi:hypothetical protein